MTTPSELTVYKAFIDGLISRRGTLDYRLQAFSAGEWPREHAEKLSALPEDIRDAIRSIMISTAEAATHDALAYLEEQDVRLEAGGAALPHAPFGSSLHEDWALRVQNLPWPDEEE
ncbi:DUF6547 family protein [Prosthecobacter fluviatilis]|uniref:DUF6547 family protein n=1 Tax=Prosthecobacter fluviatilis TaxID=445931 RepID=A0ABW0KM66_9BACT